MQAIAILRAEHRSLAAVIHGLAYVVREAHVHGTPADFALLGAMLRYIEAFPERFHHPKEDAWLFERLRLRHPQAGALLDRLQREHVEGARRIRALRAALARWRDTVGDAGREAGARSAFADLVDAYAAFHREHMRIEEREVLPLCEAHLASVDWAAIDEAFASHDDPLSGTGGGTELAELFRRIVEAAPPPVGIAQT